MHTELEVSPTGRLIDHRRLLASTLQLQDALLRKALMPAHTQGKSSTPPAMDFSSLEQRIANPCASAPYYPYGR